MNYRSARQKNPIGLSSQFTRIGAYLLSNMWMSVAESLFYSLVQPLKLVLEKKLKV